MTTKILSGTYSAGYAISPSTTVLYIERSAYVGGAGITAAPGAAPAIINNGRVVGAANGIALTGPSFVLNLGSIDSPKSGGGGNGVYLSHGGSVTNGSQRYHHSVVAGFGGGVDIQGAAGTVENYGTIKSPGAGATGVTLGDGGLLTNKPGAAIIGGSSGDGVDIGGAAGEIVNGGRYNHTPLISGHVGVYASAANVVVSNYGTIEGTGGVALRFASATDSLLVARGATFIGVVKGGGGQMDLHGGIGTISDIGGVITLTGDLTTPTTFENFDKVALNGPRLTMTAEGTIAARQTLSEGSATLEVVGTLGNAGTLIVNGKLTGSGTLALTGGETLIEQYARLRVASVEVSGADTVVQFDSSIAYAGAWTQTGGTLITNGTLTFSGGLDVLGNVTLEGNGALQLAYAAISGGATPATLTNVNSQIRGAGRLGVGHMTLVNEAGGVIDGDTSGALIINTGRQTILNAGVIEAAGAGRVRVDSAIDNTGEFVAQGGTLTLGGAVTGAGGAFIAGGTLAALKAFDEAVTFSGGGEIALAHSRTYTGAITGFSSAGATTLDLGDIAFVGASEANFSGTASGGVLSISDGAHTAMIQLVGDYLSTTFIAASDGAGGVLVTGAAAARAPQAFVAAMAVLGAGAPASATPGGEAIRAAPSMLALTQK